jgi:hypothetical protein
VWFEAHRKEGNFPEERGAARNTSFAGSRACEGTGSQTSSLRCFGPKDPQPPAYAPSIVEGMTAGFLTQSRDIGWRRDPNQLLAFRNVSASEEEERRSLKNIERN